MADGPSSIEDAAPTTDRDTDDNPRVTRERHKQRYAQEVSFNNIKQQAAQEISLKCNNNNKSIQEDIKVSCSGSTTSGGSSSGNSNNNTNNNNNNNEKKKRGIVSSMYASTKNSAGGSGGIMCSIINSCNGDDVPVDNNDLVEEDSHCSSLLRTVRPSGRVALTTTTTMTTSIDDNDTTATVTIANTTSTSTSANADTTAPPNDTSDPSTTTTASLEVRIVIGNDEDDDDDEDDEDDDSSSNSEDSAASMMMMMMMNKKSDNKSSASVVANSNNNNNNNNNINGHKGVEETDANGDESIGLVDTRVVDAMVNRRRRHQEVVVLDCESPRKMERLQLQQKVQQEKEEEEDTEDCVMDSSIENPSMDDEGGGANNNNNNNNNSHGNSRLQGSPFKGQIRTAEDTLVGPCGKKRCADRYDSSESSDSGVAVSCGECSSSGTSDITEPGSPCSTSSDEGVAIRGSASSPLPSLPKLAPSSHSGTRPQWPWTPPLATTACSTYKRLKGEPEAGTLPRSGAADPTSRTNATAGKNSKSNSVNQNHHHHHESQGKITEYFKTQIKPQQLKSKKTTEAMSVLVAKSSPEFRRPPTVQRNKGGLAKYLGGVLPNGRILSSSTTGNNDWDIQALSTSPLIAKKQPPAVVVPRATAKLDKKLPKPVPSLPISNDVHKALPTSKITNFRLTSEPNSNGTKVAPTINSTASLTAVDPIIADLKDSVSPKPHINENNNLTNACTNITSRSQVSQDPLSRLTEEKKDAVAADEEDDDDEDSSRSSESKPTLSPILSTPTTIRFPAQARQKDRSQSTDSGICRWDKCDVSFDSSTALLEHLQAAHINTQTGGDNFVCHWQGCKVQGRTSCSRRWLERHVLSHGGNKPFRCIVDGCGSRFSSQTALERHVNGHFNQPETSSSSGRRSCENGGKLVRRNGKRLRYRRQPWSARLFDYFDSGVMEGLQHRLLELAKSRTQGRLAETPGNSMALTSQVLARRVEMDGKTKVLLRWYPRDIEPDEWVLESEVESTKHVGIRKVASSQPEEVSLALYPAINGGVPPLTRVKQRRKPVKNS